MNSEQQKILEGKRRHRKTLAALTPEEKAKIIGNLNERSQVAKRGGQKFASATGIEASIGDNTGLDGRVGDEVPRRFGGRATSSGVNYEVAIAAWTAVKMLVGETSAWWEDLSGGEIEAITMQTSTAVDDIAVDLKGPVIRQILITAKDRSGPISLTLKATVFTETITSLVRQYLSIQQEKRHNSRLVWAVPTTAGTAVIRHLAGSLGIHRDFARDTSLALFLESRRAPEQRALGQVLDCASIAWTEVLNSPPSEAELRGFLAVLYVEMLEFGFGARNEREAESELRTHVVKKASDAPAAWTALKQVFSEANETGLRVSGPWIRSELNRRGIKLKTAPDFASDVAMLEKVTRLNLWRLREHTELRFGSSLSDALHIERKKEAAALEKAVNMGPLLLAGDPGSGKSGMVHGLATFLNAKSYPTVLLLAEDFTAVDNAGFAALPGLDHPLHEVLAHWPNAGKGFVITDALDAVRDGELLERLRHTLEQLKQEVPNWTVVASVREYELTHSEKLRSTFPGEGVEGFANPAFAGVAHFYLPKLTQDEVDWLARQRKELRPFLEKARDNRRSGDLHRIPFYLHIAAELLRTGTSAKRLSDWNSPALLLRKFWFKRVEESRFSDEAEIALGKICRQMVARRRMVVSKTELPLTVDDIRVIRSLRARGVLQSAPLHSSGTVPDDEIRFAHHLLHDYAVARTLIPGNPEAFFQFASGHPLLPVFYRQSFLFGLENIWDADATRKQYWQAALAMEHLVHPHGLARILGPALAARRIEHFSDVEPLLALLADSASRDEFVLNGILHLATGVEDTSPSLLQSASGVWAPFCQRLGGFLASVPRLENALITLLRTLNEKVSFSEQVEQVSMNEAARDLLAYHLKRPIAEGGRWRARVAIEVLCRTYAQCSTESEAALRSLLTKERLVQFPYEDLWELADKLDLLGNQAPKVVARLFEAAFSDGPKPGEYRGDGSRILSLRFQTSDDWNGVHYILANYYEKQKGDDATLLTDLACITWNFVSRRRESGRSKKPESAGKVEFRGVSCKLPRDYSHIWGREFEHEESRILGRFEGFLRHWAGQEDTLRLNQSLDAFVRRNRTSYVWGVLMEIGAEFPKNLGLLLAPALECQTFLSESDYIFGGLALFKALHREGSVEMRQMLEKSALVLEQRSRDEPKEMNSPHPTWLEQCLNRVLGVMEEPNIVYDPIRSLWKERKEADELVELRKPIRPRAEFRQVTPEEGAKRMGVDLAQPENRALFDLTSKVKALLDKNGVRGPAEALDANWSTLEAGDAALEALAGVPTGQARELWAHVVAVCAAVAMKGAWDKADIRWTTVRRILLKAASDSEPLASEYPEDKEEGFLSWGWPAPRIDAAQGLPLLVGKTEAIDEGIATALRALVVDHTWPVRFNLVIRLSAMIDVAPGLVWELLDEVIGRERRFDVLNACLNTLNRLWNLDPEKVMARVNHIATLAKEAKPKHEILDSLGNIYLFRYLRSMDLTCRAYVDEMVQHCDEEWSYEALLPQLHTLRVGGWLTGGDVAAPEPDYDAIRNRSWHFLGQLMEAAQAKLAAHRTQWLELHKDGKKPSDEDKQPLKDAMDRAVKLVDGIAAQLYFASGAFGQKGAKSEDGITPEKLPRFWVEASPVIRKLANEPHPHTAYQLVELLRYLMPQAPRDTFLLAAQSILSSAKAEIQFEPLAVTEVVKLIQRALADYPTIFQVPGDDDAIKALLAVLDLFVEAGWREARELTLRLEDIYR